jgi:hypothetical protein
LSIGQFKVDLLIIALIKAFDHAIKERAWGSTFSSGRQGSIFRVETVDFEAIELAIVHGDYALGRCKDGSYMDDALGEFLFCSERCRLIDLGVGEGRDAG